MGLSARTDDLTGQPIGEGYVSVATSAGYLLVFRDASSLNDYRAGNRGQLAPGAPQDGGTYNQSDQAPSN